MGTYEELSSDFSKWWNKRSIFGIILEMVALKVAAGLEFPEFVREQKAWDNISLDRTNVLIYLRRDVERRSW